jgi:DNA mismatch repair protein MutL
MAKIQKLPEQTINQIAAGEVVERPSSIIKELVENSLDAGATRIDIAIEDGGITHIEIRDNGYGIDKDDLPKAIERFATSKLSSIEDLNIIATYGFRGEALASISAVSKLAITSKTKDSDAAYTIIVNQGMTEPIKPSSRGVGTTIDITDLFSTLPARQKFLKSKDTEAKYITEMVQNMALVRSDVYFTLTHNDKEIYNLPPVGENMTLTRTTAVLKVPHDHFVPVQFTAYGTSVSGFIVHPKFLGETSRFIRIFVNGRAVEDKGIVRSLQKGIEKYVPHTFRAAGVLSIVIDSSQLDVNVHPRKTEVKFLNPFRIYSTVSQAVESSLQSMVGEEMGLPPRVSDSTYLTGAMSSRWDSNEQKALSRLRQNNDYSASPMMFQSPSEKYGTDLADLQQHEQSEASTTSEYAPAIDLQKLILARTASQQEMISVTALLGRYILVEWEQEIWLIDQHAAAERIRFESLKRSYLYGKSLPQQQLLVPTVFPISPTEHSVLSQHIDVLEKLGFTATITDEALSITSIPVFLQKADSERILREAVAELATIDNLGLIPDVSDFSSTKDISLVIATVACHNSIRMNERLAKEEATSLVKDLLACEVPYACPHGRRVVWMLSTEMIDRQFMRP